MKKISLFLLFLLIPAVSNSQQNTTRFFVQFAFETITVSTSAVTPTAATIVSSPFQAELAEYSIEGCSVRYRVGTNPTSTVGTLLTTGSGRIYGYNTISRIRFIRDTSCSADATINVNYYR